MGTVQSQIAKTFKKIRIEHNMTQSFFAENVLNSNRKRVVRIEKGTTQVSLNELINVSIFFNLNLIQILLDIDEIRITNIIQEIHLQFQTIHIDEKLINELLKKIKSFPSYSRLSTNTHLKISIIQGYFNYMLTNSTEHIEDLLPPKIDSNLDHQLRLLNLQVFLTENEKLLELLKKNLSNIKEESKYSWEISIILNCLGSMIKNNNIQLISENLLNTIQKIILASEEYDYFLPVFLYYYSQYYKLKNDEFQYNRNKNAAISKLIETNQKHLYQTIKTDKIISPVFLIPFFF